MTDRTNENASRGATGADVAGGEGQAAFEAKQQSNNTPSSTRLTDPKQAALDAQVIKSRSTSTETQQAKALALLRAGPQTSYSLRANGIAQCAARIFELRAMGHIITTERVKAIDSDSFVHVGAARYRLVKEAPIQTELPGVSDE